MHARIMTRSRPLILQPCFVQLAFSTLVLPQSSVVKFTGRMQLASLAPPCTDNIVLQTHNVARY